VDERTCPIGILTDRDIVLRCLTSEWPVEAIRIGDVMSVPVRTVSETTAIEETLAKMRSLGVRRLPVADAAARLVGIVALDDIVDLLAGELSDIGSLLRTEAPALP
jgi:CBS domain-containing protein